MVELFVKLRPEPIFLWQFLLSFASSESVSILIEALGIKNIKDFEKRDKMNLMRSAILETHTSTAEIYVKKLISMNYLTIGKVWGHINK